MLIKYKNIISNSTDIKFDSLEDLKQECKKYKTFEDFYFHVRPIRYYTDIDDKLRLRYFGDTPSKRTIEFSLFPPKYLKGTGITKDRLLSVLRDFHKQYRSRKIIWALGLTGEGKALANSLEKDGYLMNEQDAKDFGVVTGWRD